MATAADTGKRKIVINPVTRVEGHGKVTIHIDAAGNVEQARFHIIEFRGFERFVQGRFFWEAPVMVQRLCGICPVSHHLASVKACDEVAGVEPPRPATAPLTLAQVIARARRESHGARAARQTLDAWRELETDVRRLTAVTVKRAAEGDISPYEQQRLRTELSRLQWRITEAAEALRSAESTLAFALGIAPDSLARIHLVLPRLAAGSLDTEALVRVGLQEREDVLGLQEERASLERHRDWLRRRWMEDIKLGGGYKKQSDTFSGPVISLSLPLPVFDRDQGNAAAAEAERSALTIEQETLERRVKQEIHRAVSAYHALSKQARQLAAPTPEEYNALLASASSAYAEGEFSLVEYIDAITAYMESAELDAHVRTSLLRAAFTVEHAVGSAVFTVIESN